MAAEKLRTRDRRTNVVRRKWNFLVTKKNKKKQRDHNNYVHVYVLVSLSAPTDPLSKRHAQRKKTWFNNKRRWTRIYVRHYRFSAVLRSAVRPRPNPLKHFRETVMVSLFVITKKNYISVRGGGLYAIRPGSSPRFLISPVIITNSLATDVMRRMSSQRSGVKYFPEKSTRTMQTIAGSVRSFPTLHLPGNIKLYYEYMCVENY